MPAPNPIIQKHIRSLQASGALKPYACPAKRFKMENAPVPAPLCPGHYPLDSTGFFLASNIMNPTIHNHHGAYALAMKEGMAHYFPRQLVEDWMTHWQSDSFTLGSAATELTDLLRIGDNYYTSYRQGAFHPQNLAKTLHHRTPSNFETLYTQQEFTRAMAHLHRNPLFFSTLAVAGSAVDNLITECHYALTAPSPTPKAPTPIWY